MDSLTKMHLFLWPGCGEGGLCEASRGGGGGGLGDSGGGLGVGKDWGNRAALGILLSWDSSC